MFERIKNYMAAAAMRKQNEEFEKSIIMDEQRREMESEGKGRTATCLELDHDYIKEGEKFAESVKSVYASKLENAIHQDFSEYIIPEYTPIKDEDFSIEEAELSVKNEETYTINGYKINLEDYQNRANNQQESEEMSI